ncbi:MAG: DUF362 domain-containing protein [Bacteroidales bacterium]|nr:DUF362 domain-containing protein [Bacteroidales bacterium]
MRRRDFIKKSALLTAAVGLYGNLTASVSKLVTPSGNTVKPAFDLVAIKGGELVPMFEKAIAEMGGMQAFVKRGQSVVVKPNIGWDVPPERGGCTQPALVAKIIEHCLKAGARRVLVLDNTCDNWQKCYKNSGIENAVIQAGGQMVPANLERYYKDVEIPGAKVLKNAKVHEQIINCDVFINVPVLKHHSSTTLTICMKNLMGIVWDRRFWHRNNLNQCIADMCLYRKPDLNIVDAYLVMTKNGPRGTSVNDVVQMKNLLIGTDIVAVDAAAALVFGAKPADIGFIKLAHDMKIGSMELSGLKIQRLYM